MVAQRSPQRRAPHPLGCCAGPGWRAATTARPPLRFRGGRPRRAGAQRLAFYALPAGGGSAAKRARLTHFLCNV